MTTKPEIIEAMQFSYLFSKDPINTAANPRETITWQYAGSSEPVDLPTGTTYTGWTAFGAAEKTALEAQLAHIETFLNVDFVEITGSADPDLDVGKVTLAGTTTGMGGNRISSNGTTIRDWDGYAVFDNTLDLSLDTQTNLLLHELGHAMGLKHPFSGPALPDAEDTNKYTVMSYDDNPDNGEKSDAMMLYDVFALQDIWGQAGYLSGDTSYVGSRTDTVDTVWDSGGTDTFDASAKTSGVTLDLGQGNFSKFATVNDVVIAYGTDIENATGGAGGDTITGNDLANTLKGNGGNDTIVGGAKGDTLKGGKGKDILKGELGNDKIDGGAGRDTLNGGKGDDRLAGGKGNDKLKGGKGDDTLQGMAGNDKLWGNAGSDRFVYAKDGDNDTIRDFTERVDEIMITGLGSTSAVLAMASDVGGDVVFDFGGGDTLTVQGTTMAAITDDILT